MSWPVRQAGLSVQAFKVPCTKATGQSQLHTIRLQRVRAGKLSSAIDDDRSMAQRDRSLFTCNNDYNCYHVHDKCFHYENSCYHTSDQTVHDYIRVNARVNGIELNGVGVADKGANICVISRHAIMGEHYDLLVTPCEKECGGISGRAESSVTSTSTHSHLAPSTSIR